MKVKMVITGLSAALLVGACTWVKPDEGAEKVALVKQQAVGACKKLGHTTSTTLNSVVGIKRSEEKKTEELVTLAKNQAANMGGDTITAIGQLEKGEQEFAVYRCR